MALKAEELNIPVTPEILLCYENEAEIDDEKLPFKIDVKQKYIWKFLKSMSYGSDELKIVFHRLRPKETQDYFHFAISCLATFVQANFTGPPLDSETSTFLTENLDDDKTSPMLTVNNEEINVNTKFPSLLVASQLLFKFLQLNSFAGVWWYWRSLLIHQKILDELSPTLLSTADTLQKEIKNINLSSNLQALFELEQAQLLCEFRSVAKAEEHINKACDIMGFKYEQVGKLGKRTRFQKHDIAQLTMEVSHEEKPDVERPEVKKHKVPVIIPLKDEIRLDKIDFANDNKETCFSDLEQRILLLLAYHMLISRPIDDLFFEEIRPFIEIILSQNNTWAVREATLLLRTKIETKQNRTIERSLMQCEELVTVIREEKPHALKRIAGVFSTPLMPIWKSLAQYADLMLNLGLVKSALESYTSLQLWEEVIVCYTILQMRHKAAEVIKGLLVIKPTVKLWCLLGEVTDDLRCFEQGWELSKRRSHRVQRHWGHHYYNRKQYAECIPHFEKSVSINPLQAVVWLRLGFAALETQNWQIAATAYRRYTTLEPDGFEAWNNLAQAYLKLGNKHNAHRALKDALRCNFENWKVWENFLIVSANIGSWQDVICAYHKLLDLNHNYLFTGVLGQLVNGVLNASSTDSNKNEFKKTQELLGRVTSICQNDGEVWELYSKVAPIHILEMQRIQRAYRCFTQGNWSKDPKNCINVLRVCLRLGQMVVGKKDELSSITNSVRLNMSSAIAVVKKVDYENTKPLLQEVTAMLAKVIEKCKTMEEDKY